MSHNLTPGDRIKDNDPRKPGRELQVIEVLHKAGFKPFVRATETTEKRRPVMIQLNRIYMDNKSRRTGFSFVKENSLG